MGYRGKRSNNANELNLSVGTVLDKAPTGVRGLDEILHGGLPCGRCTIVSGGPGTGKSVLGLEFLAFGAQNGIPGIFVAFEERAEAVRENAMTLGIDLRALEKSGCFFILDARTDPEAVVSGDFDLKGMLAIIGGKAAKMGARQIVFDAMDVLLKLYDDPMLERKELYLLHNWLLDHQFTTLITAKNEDYPQLGHSFLGHSFMDFMMDCVIFMNSKQRDQVTTRRIRVVKYRGSSYSSNEHPFIFKNGLRVIPLSSVLLARAPLPQHMTTGSGELDAMLNGGYMRSASIIIAGQSGTGKTTAACMFAKCACARREKVLFVSYEESQEEILTNMLSPGIDLKPAVKAGTLRFMNIMPESRAADEHLVNTIDAIEEFQPEHVVLDAISACKRMGTTQTAFEFVTRIINACKARGITLMLVNQFDRSEGSSGDISGIGISSLIDTTVLMQYKRTEKETRRIIEIVKSRGSMHSNEIRDYFISERGLEIDGNLHGKGKPPVGGGAVPRAKGGEK